MRQRRLPKKHTPIDKSVLPFGHGRREENPVHLEWIRTLPCCATGRKEKTEAAHIRHQTDGGAGKKPSDKWTVPLSQAAHRRQHGLDMSEVAFWIEYGGVKRAKKLALDLYAISGNTKQALQLLQEFRKERFGA